MQNLFTLNSTLSGDSLPYFSESVFSSLASASRTAPFEVPVAFAVTNSQWILNSCFRYIDTESSLGCLLYFSFTFTRASAYDPPVS
jgi:hypothetical protein